MNTAQKATLYRPTDAEAAYEAWNCNCGPAAMAALAGVECNELRNYLKGFKGYTTPSLVLNTLRSMGIVCEYGKPREWPPLGMVCIQFSGPWLEKGVHWAEPYKRSHYIAVSYGAVYDVNCDCWISKQDWEVQLAPELCAMHKGNDGTWYARSCVVVEKFPEANV